MLTVLEEARQRSARERVVAREDHRLAIPGDRDVVLMVVPAHPVDGTVLSGPHVERDDHAGLALRRVTGRRRPGILLPIDVVRRFLVGEEDLPAERFPPRRQEVRAEALISRCARDRERTVQHSRRALTERQLAHLCVVEVVLPIRGGGRGGDIREWHLARLVVDVQVNDAPAPWTHRDPVRDGLESVSAGQHVTHRQQRRDHHVGCDGGEHRRLCGLETALVTARMRRGRRGRDRRSEGDADKDSAPLHGGPSPEDVVCECI